MDTENKVSDEEELRLRDQFAMAALPALIERFNQKVKTSWIGKDPKLKTTNEFQEDIAEIAVMAYKIADEMRKARIAAFK